jgi:hypothetical protein
MRRFRASADQIDCVKLLLRQLRDSASVHGAAGVADERRVRAVRPPQRRAWPSAVVRGAAHSRAQQQQRQHAPPGGMHAARRRARPHAPRSGGKSQRKAYRTAAVRAAPPQLRVSRACSPAARGSRACLRRGVRATPPQPWRLCRTGRRSPLCAPGCPRRRTTTRSMTPCWTGATSRSVTSRSGPQGARRAGAAVCASPTPLTRPPCRLGLGAKYLSHARAAALMDPIGRKMQRQLGANRAARLAVDGEAEPTDARGARVSGFGGPARAGSERGFGRGHGDGLAAAAEPPRAQVRCCPADALPPARWTHARCSNAGGRRQRRRR